MKALFLAVLFALFVYCPAMATEPAICKSGEEEMSRSYSNFFDEGTNEEKAWQIVESYEVCRDQETARIYIYESDITGFVMELHMAEVPYEISEDGIITIPDISPDFKISLITGLLDVY